MRAPQYSQDPQSIFKSEFIYNPFPILDSLRKNSPISSIGNSGFHLISSFELIQEVLDREADFSANLKGVLYRSHDGNPDCFDLSETGALDVIATADGANHARHKKVLANAFTTKSVMQYETYIRKIADKEIQKIKVNGGSCIATIEKIPAMVISKLIGLPDTEYDDFMRWIMIGGSILAGEISSEGLHYLAVETEKMSGYLLEKFDLLQNPNFKDQSLLSVLRDAFENGVLSQEEAIGIAIILFGAGGESTSALMGSSIYHLATKSEIQNELRKNNELIVPFIEEVIRMFPPFRFHYRHVNSDCFLGGYPLVSGEKLLLSWDSANRDENQFDNPNEFSLKREKPKNHMGFGRGAHFCIGATLARLEVKIFIETLLESFDQFKLKNEPCYLNSIFVRRFTSLEIE
ncbi:MAG: cytochrome P450 [Candidatus Micropelagos sp.]|uniref:Cytochrome P450 n=1 Tax=PS1 clade bacterium TaxID=2175152 RepID=A0A368EG26_9PROT|nr:MAG: cytochrome P450 [PS1 clade bacterium]